MMNITGKDYRDILDTLYTVNCCQDRESFLNTLMPSMVKLFHADCVTFHLLEGCPWHIKVLESRSFKSDKHNLNEDKVYPELYRDNFYQQSPLLRKALDSSKVILKIGESISLKDWERSELYNGFILPQNLYWEMFLTLRWNNNLEGMITLWRSKGQGDYGDADILKAEVLAPHLMAATHNVEAMSRVGRRMADFITSEENSPEGLLLLDARLKPLYFNSRARQLCNQINNCSPQEPVWGENSEFPIPLCILQDCNALLELLKIEDQPILWPKEQIVISEGNQKIRVECSLIWKADHSNSQPNLVVTLNGIQSTQNSQEHLQARYNLSRRELDIIYYLNKGLSYSEIGETLFISKLTVHTHVKNIYRKLGAKSRIELYRYVQTPSWMK
jgi:DNA-binding CsgD family transcriptional regulator